ncbi:MAG: TIGR01620 family protein [Pseudomonadota bacterium]
MTEETTRKTRGPVRIDLDAAPKAAAPTPADVAPVPDTDWPDGDGMAPTGQAMQTAAALAARRPSRLARWFWSLLVAVIGFFVSLATWNAIAGLLAANPILGLIATALVIALGLVALAIIAREIAGFARLGRLDRLHHDAEAAIVTGDLALARKVTGGLTALYANRDDTRMGRERVAARRDDVLDADGLLALAERELLEPLDQLALREVEAAARQVATVTALVPLALADVVAALTSNVRMIRRVAEVYGGRSGTLGSWRLARSVLAHLVATGAVAAGDDLLGSVAGGSILAKVSRRFGEGIVNGALTARVGVAAMEVCRPLPFRATPRPRVSGVVTRALTGLFEGREKQGGDG